MRLDLHCHSTASDGSFTLWELADMAARVGLDGLVVTDHCSPSNAFNTNQILVDVLSDLEVTGVLTRPFRIPIIIGSEIATPYGEFLLFGSKACKQWDHYKSKLKIIADYFGVESYWEMFQKYVLHKITHDKESNFLSSRVVQPLSYAMVLCHPRDVSFDWCNKMPDLLWRILHGFEIQNGFEHYDHTMPEIVDWLRKRIKNCKCLRNSDCHGDELGMAYNEIAIDEVSENSLIHWFRS